MQIARYLRPCRTRSSSSAARASSICINRILPLRNGLNIQHDRILQTPLSIERQAERAIHMSQRGGRSDHLCRTRRPRPRRSARGAAPPGLRGRWPVASRLAFSRACGVTLRRVARASSRSRCLLSAMASLSLRLLTLHRRRSRAGRMSSRP